MARVNLVSGIHLGAAGQAVDVSIDGESLRITEVAGAGHPWSFRIRLTDLFEARAVAVMGPAAPPSPAPQMSPLERLRGGGLATPGPNPAQAADLPQLHLRYRSASGEATVVLAGFTRYLREVEQDIAVGRDLRRGS